MEKDVLKNKMEEVYSPAAEVHASCYVNDHCIVEDDLGLFHLFHIKGFVKDDQWNGMSELMFGHAVSKDLKNWVTQPQCIPALNDEKRVAAPNIAKLDDIYYMFYNSFAPQTIRMATSRDLYQWHRNEKAVFVPHHKDNGGWSNGQGRDPFIYKHGDVWLLYYTTMYWDGKQFFSSIGLAESDDLLNWKDKGPAFIAKESGNVNWSQTESPCLFTIEEKYYLVITDRIVSRITVFCSNDPYQFSENNSLSIGDFRASKIYEIRDKWYMTHCFIPTEGRGRGFYIAEVDIEKICEFLRF